MKEMGRGLFLAEFSCFVIGAKNGEWQKPNEIGPIWSAEISFLVNSFIIFWEKIIELPSFDAIFISHSFSDHCNKETLLQFPETTPIIAIPSILRKIKSWGYFQNLISLEQAPFEMLSYKPSGLLDLVHHAYLLKTKNTTVLFAPHGSKNQKTFF